MPPSCPGGFPPQFHPKAIIQRGNISRNAGAVLPYRVPGTDDRQRSKEVVRKIRLVVLFLPFSNIFCAVDYPSLLYFLATTRLANQ